MGAGHTPKGAFFFCVEKNGGNKNFGGFGPKANFLQNLVFSWDKGHIVWGEK